MARALKGLLMERRVVMVGMVPAEILQGIRSPKDALGRLPYLEITKEMWENAEDLSASLRKRGKTIPLSALVIAMAALSADHEIFTVDPHFNDIEGIRLYLS